MDPLPPPRKNDDDEDSGAARRTGALAGLAVALALIVLALFLVRRLRTEAVIEDCLMAGRANCESASSGR